MKYLMVFFALVSFGLAFWVTGSMRSDIQFILLVLGAMGGCIFIGFAAVLDALDRRR